MAKMGNVLLERQTRRLSEMILRRPKTHLAVAVLLTLLVASAAPRTQYDSSIRSFILEHDADYAFYNTYKETFGQDDVLVVAFEAPQIFSPEVLALIRRLTERLETIDNIFDVRSLTNTEYMKGTGDSFEAVPLIGESIPDDPGTLATRQSIAVGDPLFSRDLISPDGRKTAILVTLRTMDDADYTYEREIGAIETVIREESARSGVTIHLIGERYLDGRFLRYIHKDLKVFVPLTYLLLAVVICLMVRNVRFTVIAIIAISMCLAWTGGLIPLLGQKMNSINAGAPSLILCVAVADVIHTIHRYRKKLAEIGEAREAMGAALQEVIVPCFLTSLTTAIGFGSLVSSALSPIKGFGLLSAVAVMAAFVISMTVVPCLILLWKEKPGARAQDASLLPAPWFERLFHALDTRRGAVTVVVLFLLAASAAGIFRVDMQSDRTRYLKPSSDIYRALDFVDRHLVGTTQLDIWLETGKEGMIKEPDVLRKIESLAEFLRAQPEIAEGGKVLSINEFLKAMNKAFHEDDPRKYELPDTRDKVAQFLLMYSMSGKKNELNKYVDYPYSRTRISVRTAEHNSAKLDALIRKIRAYLPKHFHAPLDARLASVAVVHNNVFHYLLKGLLVNLGTAVLLIGAVMCLCYRSVYVGLVSMIPNVIPLLLALGLMGWMGVYLEVATAMTFSIAIGIAVDDTIHLLTRARFELAKAGDYRIAMRATLRDLGSALVETTAVMVGGFLVLVFASLKMNIVFGLLCAFIMVAALLADLVVTPLCIVVLRPFGRGGPGAKADDKKEDAHAGQSA